MPEYITKRYVVLASKYRTIFLFPVMQKEAIQTYYVLAYKNDEKKIVL